MFVAGSAIQWLRDGLGVIGSAARSRRWRSVESTGASTFVPAFIGTRLAALGPDAAGLIRGITRGTTRTRSVRPPRGDGHQVLDVFEAMPLDVGVAFTRCGWRRPANDSSSAPGRPARPAPSRFRRTSRRPRSGQPSWPVSPSGLWSGPDEVATARPDAATLRAASTGPEGVPWRLAGGVDGRKVGRRFARVTGASRDPCHAAASSVRARESRIPDRATSAARALDVR